jgi:asparagine synthase (glutamine-hydrolysing)
MRSRDELVRYLVARMRRLTGGAALRDVLTEGWYEAVRDGAQRSLEESLAGVEHSPANMASHLYLWEYQRRSAIASLEVFRTVVEVRLPFMDEEFLRVCFAGRSDWRDGTEIHRTVIGRLNPGLLRVRNSNTGAPAGAGPKLEAVLDKVNSVLRRLDVYGYRHYHNFGAWMSQQLVTAVESVLLSGDSLARGILRESGLRRLIEASKRGATEHSYLLQALLVLELWQQESL